MGNMLKFIKEIVFGTQYCQFSVQKGARTLATRGMGLVISKLQKRKEIIYPVIPEGFCVYISEKKLSLYSFYLRLLQNFGQ